MTMHHVLAAGAAIFALAVPFIVFTVILSKKKNTHLSAEEREQKLSQALTFIAIGFGILLFVGAALFQMA